MFQKPIPAFIKKNVTIYVSRVYGMLGRPPRIHGLRQ